MDKGQVGLGVDIVQITRMEAVLTRRPTFRRVFSAAEQEYCDSMTNPAVHYATRFAAKEAVLKALGTGFTQGVRPTDVEVARTAHGRPYAILHGKAKDVAQDLGVYDLPISLSHTHHDAVACAMALTRDAAQAAIDRIDPMEELAKKFKEARGMLDEMDGNADGDE